LFPKNEKEKAYEKRSSCDKNEPEENHRHKFDIMEQLQIIDSKLQISQIIDSKLDILTLPERIANTRIIQITVHLRMMKSFFLGFVTFIENIDRFLVFLKNNTKIHKSGVVVRFRPYSLETLISPLHLTITSHHYISLAF
jgi:hypothetical protein